MRGGVVWVVLENENARMGSERFGLGCRGLYRGSHLKTIHTELIDPRYDDRDFNREFFKFQDILRLCRNTFKIS